jgi:lipoprotein Spr
MPSRAERIVARARALIGVRFRPQGRSAATGLDCIGLAAAALGVPAVPRDYPPHGGGITRLNGALAAAGLREVSEARAGDLLVAAPATARLHLAIATGTGLVHADAGLRRVAERPGPPPWPVLGIWRTKED